MDDGKVRMAADGGEVLERTGGTIVDDRDRVTITQQALDEVRADEPGAARDQNISP